MQELYSKYGMTKILLDIASEVAKKHNVIFIYAEQSDIGIPNKNETKKAKS